MTYRITQREDDQHHRLTLLLEGAITPEAGSAISEICQKAADKFGGNIVVDLYGVSFLAPESSAMLCQLKKQYGLTFEGCHLFNKKIIDEAEKR